MELLSDNSVTKMLIEAVKKRPGLYNRTLKEYTDVNIKRRLWLEVCEAVVPGWRNLNIEEKKIKGQEVLKKWANLRTCFRRELNAQRMAKSKKRRKYIYFDNLLFLLPCIENCPTEVKTSTLFDQDNEDEFEDNDSNISASPPPSPKRKRAQEPKTSEKEEVDAALVRIPKETNDEDRHFALSLIPSLQRLTEEEKLDAKISILNIFRMIKLERRGQLNSHTARNFSSGLQAPSGFPFFNQAFEIQEQFEAGEQSTDPHITHVFTKQEVIDVSPGYSDDASH